MACTVNRSKNTNDENNGTQLPVHLQRENNTMSTSHTYKENVKNKKSVQVVAQLHNIMDIHS